MSFQHFIEGRYKATICSKTETNTRLVLVLYRKREGARRRDEHGVFACFRYDDVSRE